MKLFWKYLGFIVAGFVGLTYLLFLFVLPNAVNLNEYKPLIQQLAKEQAKVDVNFEDAKIITTPLLGAGIKLDNISVKLPDNSDLFLADEVKARISLPHLLLLTVKVSCFEVNNPFVNLEIVNDENFKVVKLVEDILNAGKEQKLEEEPKEVDLEEETGFQFNPAWIRIKVPNAQLNNYKVLVSDLKSKHYLDLHGEKLQLGYNNGKSAKIKTYAELYSDENKNITANVDIKTFLPKLEPALDEEDDPAERIEIPFVNPVTMYRNYDLKANLDTKLRVKSSGGQVLSHGYFNIDDVTLKVSDIQLPLSYIKAKTSGANVFLDTDFYIKEQQNIKLLGRLNYSSRPKLDMAIKTGKIQFNDMIILAKAFLDSLHVRNELNQITATGYMESDCYIKTNFKKLKSQGAFVVKNGGVSVRNLLNVISKADINVILDNNTLNIENSGLNVNNSKIYIDGKIDEKSIADIKIKADKISLPSLFYAFAPKSVRDGFNFKSADASLNLSLVGKLKDAVIALAFGLDNLDISDKANNFNLKNARFLSEFSVDAKSLQGTLTNKNLFVLLPSTKSTVSIPNLDVEIAEENVAIKENQIKFNDKSTLTYSGEIKNYSKLESLNFGLKGGVNTADLIKLIGNEFKPFIHSQGEIPVQVTLNGNRKKQTLFAQAQGNSKNYITPVDFNSLNGKNTSLQSVVDFKGNRIKIKKTGLFTITTTYDENGETVENLNEVIGVDGTVVGNTINLIKITMPKTLEGNIFAFPKSAFKISGRAFIFGETARPRLRGGFAVTNLSIPELLMAMENASLKFRGHDAEFRVNDLVLNGSDIQTEGRLSLLPSPVLNISDLKVSSRYINLDKLMKVSDCAMKYVPQNNGTKTASKPVEQADIPVRVQNGFIDMSHIVTGNINVKNTTSRMSLDKNILQLRRLNTDVFKGHVQGNILVNLVTMFLDIKLDGKNVDVEQALLDAAAMKDTLSGSADFTTDISLKGATLDEQMESLKGNVQFVVNDGQFGPFGRLENMILAENIRESQLFQTALGGVLNSLLTIDTTHFSELKGNLNFKDGICHIDPITSSGNILSLHIFGDFDLLKNEADMKVRARMASLVSNLLGPIGAINPVNLLNSAASLNVVTAKAFSIFCETVTEDEIAILPSFSNKYVDNAATKFQIVVRGDVAKPLKLVKSFKWLATAIEFDKANDFASALPDPIEGSTATNIEEAIAEAEAFEAEKKTLKYKVKHLFDNSEKNVSQELENKNIIDVNNTIQTEED